MRLEGETGVDKSSRLSSELIGPARSQDALRCLLHTGLELVDNFRTHYGRTCQETAPSKTPASLIDHLPAYTEQHGQLVIVQGATHQPCKDPIVQDAHEGSAGSVDDARRDSPLATTVPSCLVSFSSNTKLKSG